mgnify:CR=1 FL=1
MTRTELTLQEWRFLNKFSEPDSPLRNEQLRKIDDLRGKYPPGSPAQQALDVFDSRTGRSEKVMEIANLALEANRRGDITEYENLMNQLKQL